MFFDGLGVAVDSDDDEARGEEIEDGFIEIEDGVIEIGDDEVAEDVEEANVIDGFAPLTAELLDVLGCGEVAVDVLKYVSVFAALAQATYE